MNKPTDWGSTGPFTDPQLAPSFVPRGTVKAFLLRHGETEWSLSGRHTGRTDLPLTERGAQEAVELGNRLGNIRFHQVFTSPRERARQTCGLAGLGLHAVVDEDLAEWDYGEYEGCRTVEVHKNRPDWDLFTMGCPAGESPSQISDRADRVIRRLRGMEGNIALFSHGHFLRVLGARWVGLDAREASRLLLSTASMSILGYEHNRVDSPVLVLWNDVGSLSG